MRKNKEKIFILLAMMLLFAFVFSACKNKNENTVVLIGGGDDEKKDDSEKDTLRLFYLDHSLEEYKIDEVKVDSMSSALGEIDQVMIGLTTPQKNKKYHIPIVEGMTYQRYSFDGKGTVTVVFDVDNDSVDDYQLLLCKSAFTNSLCQIDGVLNVSIVTVDLINNNTESTEVFTKKSFAYMIDNEVDSKYGVTIYYPSADGESLVSKSEYLDASANESLENQILNLLSKDTNENHGVPLNKEVSINNISVIDNTCYLDFSEEFLQLGEAGIPQVIIYSIVDSLTDLEDVESVCISVEGSQDIMYGDEVDLSVKFKADYSLCK